SIARTRTGVPSSPPPSVGRTPTPPSHPPPPSRTATGETTRGVRVAVTTSSPIPELTDPTSAEISALDEPGALPFEDRRRVLSALRLVAANDPWALLGVPRGSDKRALKRAFFERSKLFHPDRFYGKSLGGYLARLHTVFEALSRAHTDLTDEGAARRSSAGTGATAPQTPAEYAAELFDRACIAEVSGDPAQALKLFAAAVKLDGQARYLRRAAVCALSAGELRAAEDYAKKAAALDGSDPSTARILGKVLHQLGKLESAEEVLVMALAMKSENDTLMKELAADLRAVRADLVR
ncbi:MAG: J domain-containing protein, partial [Deltaproteobacteria bacterium]|nr:J domain-containing protein [Kofleriaceae bacterium]